MSSEPSGRAYHHQHVAGVELVERIASWLRSVLAPLAVSRNTFLHPALVSWRTCAASTL